ncbi:hypothetical protein EDD18DRAFT_686388 [Armillaria luteobubalina]|uniref:Uncharacterized protein n=1 Tax=Armillaria luteobubalina TaxID=153913 RepID=A0AA39QG32_9AGAR|nr:hypothetical protein EDD18DRAFT_686388 [Armillaria luteobubalina]
MEALLFTQTTTPGFLSSSPPPVRELPSQLPSVKVRRSPSSIKDVASAVSLSSWAAANSIPFIYRDGEVFVPRHDDPSEEDHERRHELENMLHPLLPPVTPEKPTRQSAAPIPVRWLESRHTSESRSSHDDVANNVAPVSVVPIPPQPQPVPVTLPVQPPASLPDSTPSQPQPVLPAILPIQPPASLPDSSPPQPQPVLSAILPVQPPAPPPDPAPAVAGSSSPLTRKRENTEDSHDAAQEERPRSRRRTQ